MIGSQQAFAIGAEFSATGATFGAKTAAATAHYGAILQTKIRGRASGRPGPRVITGNYRGSIEMRLISQGFITAAVIGTDAPQGRRLELGFSGTDSLGRNYDQSPFPHFGPAFDEVKDDYVDAIGGLL